MIDYFIESEKYRPDKVKTLLIGEAPPPNGKTYFYIPKKMSLKTKIENYRSLPATIFYHYFKEIPINPERYEQLLNSLQNDGIFLMDIYDLPIKISDRSQPGWINNDNLNILISEIPNLKNKISKRIGEIKENHISFLLARNKYKKVLKAHFPISEYYTWKEFRIF